MKLALTKKILLLAYFHITKPCSHYQDHWHWGEPSAVFPAVSLASYNNDRNGKIWHRGA